MEGYEYVWAVTHKATLRLCGVFSNKVAAQADALRRGENYQAAMYRVWDTPGADVPVTAARDAEVCVLCGGDGRARRMQFSAHGAGMHQVVIVNEPCPRCQGAGVRA
jgi:hypothetical protein